MSREMKEWILSRCPRLSDAEDVARKHLAEVGERLQAARDKQARFEAQLVSIRQADAAALSAAARRASNGG